MAETDTDINNVRQDKSNLPQWPSMVHKFDPTTKTFAHKRVEHADDQARWIDAGWFATPYDAEVAATDGHPHVTQNDPAFGEDVAPIDPAPDAPSQTRGRRR